jgi:enoyl-CoA hydratase/carnithine racemase
LPKLAARREVDMQVRALSPTQAETVLIRNDADGITTLTLNRPSARNSLSLDMLTALDAAFASIAVDPAVRVVVIAAAGSVFCAGHDLKENLASRNAADGGRAAFEDTLAHCSGMMQKIQELPQPVIASVQGTATAAGCQLVASCDLAVASEKATFCTPGVHIGLFCSLPMVALSRNVAPKHTLEMLLTGDTIAAEEALRIGLVNKVVAPDRLAEETRALAAKIAAKSKLTVATGKKAFYRQLEMPVAEAYRYAAGIMADNMMAHDANEGIAAFVEKRPPKWQDR